MKIFAATLLMFVGVSAYAADNIEPNNVPFQGVHGQQQDQGKTRAQVEAELAQAKAQGRVSFGEQEEPDYAKSPAAPTRAEVQRDLSQARSNGTVTFGDLEYQAG
ncbi:DUF4148 domain-containing protein [Bordetella genomosp. 13]|uniref:DUF4148 domain-containing protein n=1 Tax=Bordetella genomosp. 13 TaxID=463040 RepID=A0A1W6Z8B8_9BORD|nr:DUF4148 domain-containing protein [Bordetella genomosp. 13]ARP93601.1 hypothetical protein CAL15_03905 [Bordetella genomosp. 13]